MLPSPSSPHSFSVRIYYEDTDAGGVVYHANYLRFAERARTEMLRSLGLEQRRLAEEEDLLFAVRSCQMELLKPAMLDDLVIIHTEIEAICGASLHLTQTLYRDDSAAEGSRTATHLATVTSHVACINRAMRPKRIPAWLRDALGS